jgi:IS5 family transposase
VRVLVIQQLHNLSDEQLEFQLLDRLSFQRFVELRQSSQAPDRTTIWTFRERLIKAGAAERIFKAVNRQLDRHGYIARDGLMVDASIVCARRGGGCTSSARVRPASRFRTASSVATDALLRPERASNMCSPAWSRWAARHCAASAWRGSRCT